MQSIDETATYVVRRRIPTSEGTLIPGDEVSGAIVATWRNWPALFNQNKIAPKGAPGLPAPRASDEEMARLAVEAERAMVEAKRERLQRELAALENGA